MGIGGLFDPASAAGLDKNDEDFGQTFGKWGIDAGPYLMLPFLGPSTLRDGIGRVPDAYSEPGHATSSGTRSATALHGLSADRHAFAPARLG